MNVFLLVVLSSDDPYFWVQLASLIKQMENKRSCGTIVFTWRLTFFGCRLQSSTRSQVFLWKLRLGFSFWFFFFNAAPVSPAFTYLSIISSIKCSYPAEIKLTVLKVTRTPIGTHTKQFPSSYRFPLNAFHPPPENKSPSSDLIETFILKDI